jgi:hypothetical protein
MTRTFDIKITFGTSPGPYTIYYNSVSAGNIATITSGGSPAENVTYSTLTTGTGLNVSIPDSSTSIILYNTLCDTQLTQSLTPVTPTTTTTSTTTLPPPVAPVPVATTTTTTTSPPPVAPVPVAPSSFNIYANSSSGTNPLQGWSTSNEACNGTGVPVTVYNSGGHTTALQVFNAGNALYVDSGLTTLYNGGNTYFTDANSGGNSFQVGPSGFIFTFSACPSVTTTTTTTLPTTTTTTTTLPPPIAPVPIATTTTTTTVVSCNCITVDVENTQLVNGGLDLYYILNDCGGGSRDVNLAQSIGTEQGGSTYFGLCGSGSNSDLYKYGISGSPFVGVAGMNVNPNGGACSFDGDCPPAVPSPPVPTPTPVAPIPQPVAPVAPVPQPVPQPVAPVPQPVPAPVVPQPVPVPQPIAPVPIAPVPAPVGATTFLLEDQSTFGGAFVTYDAAYSVGELITTTQSGLCYEIMSIQYSGSSPYTITGYCTPTPIPTPTPVPVAPVPVPVPVAPVPVPVPAPVAPVPVPVPVPAPSCTPFVTGPVSNFSGVCEAIGFNTRYHDGAGSYPTLGDITYSNSGCTIALAAGYYYMDDGNYIRVIGGGEVIDVGLCGGGPQ